MPPDRNDRLRMQRSTAQPFDSTITAYQPGVELASIARQVAAALLARAESIRTREDLDV
jgi:hypothetical protein